MATCVGKLAETSLNNTIAFQLQFGTLPPVFIGIPATSCKTIATDKNDEHVIQSKSTEAQKKMNVNNKAFIHKMHAEYNKQCAVLDKWEEEYNTTRSTNPSSYKVVLTKQQKSAVHRYNMEKARKKLKEQEDILNKCIIGPWGPSMNAFSIASGPLPSAMEAELKWPLHQTRSQRIKGTPKQPVTLGRGEFAKFVKNLTTLMTQKSLLLELCGKHVHRVCVRREHKKVYLKINTKHEEGFNKARDVVMDNFTQRLLELMITRTSGNNRHSVQNIKPGHSGFVLNRETLCGTQSRAYGRVFIVRGNHEGKLYDARIKLSQTIRRKIVRF
nr:P1 protein [Japanese yam mosaic virus]